MSRRRITFEHLMYFGIFCLALTVRLFKLGSSPLSDFEAGPALQALGVSQGARSMLGDNPVYVLLTAVNFFIFGSSSFWARFWPALAGSTIVLVPGYFKNKIGQLPALLLAFFLVFDPGLLALGRLAGSPIFAITFFALALGMWESARPGWAGVFGALALMGGSAFWTGVLSLGLAWILFRVITRRRILGGLRTETQPGRSLRDRLKPALGWGLVVVVLGGTLFFIVPNGLFALWTSFTTYLLGWWNPASVPIGIMLAAIPAYAPLALVFGLTAGIRMIHRREQDHLLFCIWAFISFLLAIINRGRQPSDLAWILLPLYTLAAIELARHFSIEGIGKWEFTGVMILSLSILAFCWIDLAGSSWMPFSSESTKTRFLLLLGALLFLLVCYLLVAVGWSLKLARSGLVWSWAVTLMVLTIGFAFGSAGLLHPQTVELWQPFPSTGQADILLQTANELSQWNTGQVAALGISIYGIDSNALRWLFRGWNTEEIVMLSADSSPDLVIAPQGAELGYPASYRGQDFTWRQTPIWNDISVEDGLRWFIFRQIHQYSETIVLWARDDLHFESDRQDTP